MRRVLNFYIVFGLAIFGVHFFVPPEFYFGVPFAGKVFVPYEAAHDFTFPYVSVGIVIFILAAIFPNKCGVGLDSGKIQ
jgi:hypothetical protein